MKGSWRFWIGFVLIGMLFLGVVAFYWHTRNGDWRALFGLARYLPVPTEMKGDLETVVTLADAVLNTGGREKTFLILFQNNLELRPGGGFIGSFGILKIRDGHVIEFASHDVINFDGRIPDGIPAPYPMWETLKVRSWKLRDSNFSPDWPTNAAKADEFYHLGQGSEQFDGIIGITTNVLSSFLTITGPVEVPGFPDRYDADNGVVNLEYQVEQGFLKQGITRGERKSVMNLLGNIIIEKVKALSLADQYRLFKVALDDLHQKDIQILFKDPHLQDEVEKAGWSGRVDQTWPHDYLLAVDANLNALKSDFKIRRSYAYQIDLSAEMPRARFSVTYRHTAEQKDFMTRDYQSFLRLYVPEGAWLENVSGNAKPVVFGSEFGKKYFGAIVQVPLGTEKTVTFTYVLPAALGRGNYDLKIEKQPGINDIPVSFNLLRKNGTDGHWDFTLNRPWTLSTAP